MAPTTAADGRTLAGSASARSCTTPRCPFEVLETLLNILVHGVVRELLKTPGANARIGGLKHTPPRGVVCFVSAPIGILSKVAETDYETCFSHHYWIFFAVSYRSFQHGFSLLFHLASYRKLKQQLFEFEPYNRVYGQLAFPCWKAVLVCWHGRHGVSFEQYVS